MFGATLVFLAVSVCALGYKDGLPSDTESSQPAQEAPLTLTPSGKFKGSWMKSRLGHQFEAYRGIKYVKPPIGELRFQPPEPIYKYEGEVDATEDGPACPQPAPADYNIDENCLRLNVYTPRTKSSQLLPVIVFLHAGGFYSMSGRSDLAGPHFLMDRDIVLVTLNYRLGSLGFLSTGDKLAPGNNGFKDQVMALRWVQRNIAAFGGDPNLVTIAGYSAGAISVMLHMISPMSKGLFHRAMSMSGSPISKVPLSRDLRSLSEKQAKLVGCPIDSTQAMIDCLKTVPFKKLGDSELGFYEFGFDPVGLWWPIVELDFGQERFMPIEPIDAIREGRMHAVPFIVSQTEDEFFWKAFYVLRNETLRTTLNNEWDEIAPISFMLPRENATIPVRRLRQAYLGTRQLTNDDVVADALGKLYSDAIVGFSVHRMANIMCRRSPKPVYYYEFSYVGNRSHYESPVTGKPTRAAHHDDLIYVFTLSYRFPNDTLTSADFKIVDKMTAIWYNFAKYGDPNPHCAADFPELKTLSWPPMTPSERKYLRISKDFSVHQNLFEERFQVWEELYPIEY